MRTKIRIGKDLKIRWPLTINGGQTDLAKIPLVVELKDMFGRTRVIPHTVQDGAVVMVLLGREQTGLGVYRLTAWANRGDIGQTVVDACEAFELVKCTCDEDKAQSNILEVESIDLAAGNMEMGIKGLSAYEIWLQNGHQGTETDFLAWLQQPATDAAKEAKDLEQELQANEEVRKQAESERQTAEAGRTTTFGAMQEEHRASVAEASRATAAADTATQKASDATGKLDTALGKVTAAEGKVEQLNTTLVQAEEARTKAEEQRVLNEQNRQTAENGRTQAEDTRKASETSRVKAEETRVKVETERAQAETDRATAEGKRATAESGRVAAEQSRATTFAVLKKESETATQDATTAGTKADDAATKANTAAVTLKKYVTEYNVSLLHPTEGIGQTNKYELSVAISKIPTEFRHIGNKCTFLDETGITRTYEYLGGDSLNQNSWKQVGYHGIIDAKMLAFIDLWRIKSKKKGDYNFDSGFFELYKNDGGLTDITYEEALRIYNIHFDGLDQSEVYSSDVSIRTCLPHISRWGYTMNRMFQNNTTIEVIYLHVSFKELQIQSFYHCSNLRKVIGCINFINRLAKFDNMTFSECKNLEYIGLNNLYNDIDFHWSPLLNLDTFVFLVEKKRHDESATVIVHPDVYAKLTDVNNTDWYKVLTDAAAKNISFATV